MSADARGEGAEPMAAMAEADPAMPAADRAPAVSLPAWFPGWARRMADLYFSGTTSVFALYGNTHDLVRSGESAATQYGPIAEFLAEQLFGRWDVVFHYDLGRGLRVFAGRNDARQREMAERVHQRLFDPTEVKNDPATVFAILDRVVRANLMAPEDRRVSMAILIDHASFLFPAGEPGRTSFSAASMLVTLLNWATSPYIKRTNMSIVLIDERLSDISDRLSGNPHAGLVEVPLPDLEMRRAYLEWALREKEVSSFSDFGVEQLAQLTAGISLTDLSVMLETAIGTGQRLDAGYFRVLKKRLIEKQCQGLLEFIEPTTNLDMLIGSEAVKRRLREDAELLRQGRLASLPMGYLVCGPVGTGKSFLAQCLAGDIGIPCVMLRNFRSKYVGETEGNLQRVLSVLRAMGPVVVVVDEADAALGDRNTGGDSGTSSRVFSMIATQMGDTRYRGRILWMLLTSRPDLLPIDLKRQGRAEVHIPLFYPSEPNEIQQMFMVMARTLATTLRPEDLPDLEGVGPLSGADIEGIVGRAWRASLIEGRDHVTPESLREAVADFLPSTEGLEKDLQEIAAIVECTDRQFLPEAQRRRIEQAGGRAALHERMTQLRAIVDAM